MLHRVALVLTASLLLAGLGPQSPSTRAATAPADVPATLVPRDKQVLFAARGEGVQIYVAANRNGRLRWRLEAPRAVLLDYETGRPIGTHTAGPSWIAEDGGTLTGRVLEKVEAPNRAGVPWLLLEVEPAESGRFAHVTNIQRLDTWGGRAPAEPPTKVGETREIRYEATYVFLGEP